METRLPCRPTRGSLTSPSYLARNRTLGPPLENNPEPPPSSRLEGLRLLYGLETSLSTSLQTPQEACLPLVHPVSSKRYPSRLESRAEFFASTRDGCLSPRVRLECNPEIPFASGEEHWLLDTSLDEVYWPCSHSRAIPSFPSQLEWKIGLPRRNSRIPLQLEKIHVVPPSSQDLRSLAVVRRGAGVSCCPLELCGRPGDRLSLRFRSGDTHIDYGRDRKRGRARHPDQERRES